MRKDVCTSYLYYEDKLYFLSHQWHNVIIVKKYTGCLLSKETRRKDYGDLHTLFTLIKLINVNECKTSYTFARVHYVYMCICAHTFIKQIRTRVRIVCKVMQIEKCTLW